MIRAIMILTGLCVAFAARGEMRTIQAPNCDPRILASSNVCVTPDGTAIAATVVTTPSTQTVMSTSLPPSDFTPYLRLDPKITEQLDRIEALLKQIEAGKAERPHGVK